MKNQTTVVEFIILGLSNSLHIDIFLFVILLLVFLSTVMGNLIIITLSLVDHRLHSPMYFFLRSFAVVEICFTSVITPRLLYSLLTGRKSVSLPGCFLQLCFVCFLGACMFCHGSVMSFDRYMAICHPLRYGPIMNGRLCFQLVLGCWLVSFSTMFPHVFMTMLVPFCGSNIINHFYCDTAALLHLSCTDTGHVELIVFVSATVILLGTLTVNTTSYVFIISSVMRIPSSTGRRKAFSTCSAHFLVVVILYASSITRYVQPSQRGVQDLDKVMSLLYCVVTPLFNPYIYALRNEQLKASFKDAWGRAFSQWLRL
ncbi:olfactory receptor 6C4-like [Carettochelys insculpta]|uniref:olfactory receptor 6C4-like n=1 Tax=Carettochelys insculpta TaxID=44489 RepID=UPI003EBAC1BC